MGVAALQPCHLRHRLLVHFPWSKVEGMPISRVLAKLRMFSTVAAAVGQCVLPRRPSAAEAEGLRDPHSHPNANATVMGAFGLCLGSAMKIFPDKTIITSIIIIVLCI